MYSYFVDLDEEDEKEKLDLNQHLTWEIAGTYEDKLRRIQDQATKIVEDINKLKVRRAKKESELESVR